MERTRSVITEELSFVSLAKREYQPWCIQFGITAGGRNVLIVIMIHDNLMLTGQMAPYIIYIQMLVTSAMGLLQQGVVWILELMVERVLEYGPSPYNILMREFDVSFRSGSLCNPSCILWVGW